MRLWIEHVGERRDRFRASTKGTQAIARKTYLNEVDFALDGLERFVLDKIKGGRSLSP